MTANVTRLDPILAYHGLRAPEELDGRRVVKCLSVEQWRGNPIYWDAWFVVENFNSAVMATTGTGGRTWRTVVSSK